MLTEQASLEFMTVAGSINTKCKLSAAYPAAFSRLETRGEMLSTSYLLYRLDSTRDSVTVRVDTTVELAPRRHTVAKFTN